MERILSSIASNASRYTNSEKAYLLDVCQNRETVFKDDSFIWFWHLDQTGSDFCDVLFFKASELIRLTSKIKESVQEGNVARTQNLAAQQEKVFRCQYLPMRDAAATVLQHEGFTRSNVRLLEKTLWPKIAKSTCEPDEPPVILNTHPDLRHFLNIFFKTGCPSTDFISADMFNKGYKPKKDTEVQLEMKDLIDGGSGKKSEATILSTTDSGDETKKELHEYVDAVRDGMNTVSVEADLPEPMATISLGFPPPDTLRNPGGFYEPLERNPSISSSLCSDNYEEEDFVLMVERFCFRSRCSHE